VKLYGSYRDTFGLPVTTLWTLRSGAGPATIADPASLETDFTASVEGVYVFRLTATNAIETVHDDVQIFLRKGALEVNAGPDQTTYSVDGVVVGSVTRDTYGLPLTLTWSMVSGPGAVTFDNPSSPSTGFHMSFLGTYVLRLTATNGLATASDDLTVSPKISGRTWGGPAGVSGDFQWYGFKPFNWFYNGRVADYYLLDTGSGFSMGQSWAAPPYSNPRMGYIDAVSLGGARVVNVTTGVVSGDFGTTWEYSGNMCSGSSFRSSYGGFTGDSFVDKSSIHFADLLPFFTNIINGGTTREYVTGDYPEPPGWLDTYCGNPVWGNPGDIAREELSEQMTVDQAAANGGSAEVSFTGHTRVESYSPTTGLAVGVVSERDVVTKTPSKTGWVLATFSYTATPIAGGASTDIVELVPYQVGVGGLLDTTRTIPMIVGQDVVCTSIAYQDLGVFMDDGEQLPADSYYGSNQSSYPTLVDWPQSPAFQTDGPGEFWDDGEDLDDGVVSITTGGNNWAATGLLSAFDIPGEFWDDGEGYPDGELDFETLGQGWLEKGYFTILDYTPFDDAGEDYPDGALTATTGGDSWLGDGSFQVDS